MRGQSLRTALATSLFLAIAAPSWSCGTMEPPSAPASPPPDNSGSMNNGGGEQNPGGGGSWNNGGGEGLREGAANTATTDLGEDGGGGGRRSQPPGGGGGQNFTSQISSLGASNAGTGGGQNFTSQISALGPANAGTGGGGGLAPVWCLMQRQAANGNQEQTVIKCDDMAGAGPSWRPIASNLTFTAASAARDSFNAGNPAMVWCVMQRLRADGFTYEQTVIRCDDMAGAGPGWFPTGSPNLDFTTASSMRDAFNAANPPR